MGRTLSDDDIVEVLEEIIRESGNAQARIAAIRALREMENREVPSGAFEALDQLAPKRAYRTKQAA